MCPAVGDKPGDLRDHSRVAQDITVAKTGGLDQSRSRPGTDELDSVGKRNGGVLPIVKNEKGCTHAARVDPGIEIIPAEPESALAASPQALHDRGRKPEHPAECVGPLRRVGRRSKEDVAARGETPGRGQHGRGGAE